jgi:endonuclease III
VDAKSQAAKVLKALRAAYPDADCELRWANPLQLLVATILSAQCTDVRVNKVTESLFKKYRTARDFAEAGPAALESEIRSTGFFRSKARSVLGAARLLVDKHGGVVPKTMDELLELPGVARKTANVVLGTAYKIASGIVVDTHVKRLAYRLGLTSETDPEKVEKDLQAVVPKKDWIFFGHSMIWHGRRVCFAARPDCPNCPMRSFCPKRGV